MHIVLSARPPCDCTPVPPLLPFSTYQLRRLPMASFCAYLASCAVFVCADICLDRAALASASPAHEPTRYESRSLRPDFSIARTILPFKLARADRVTSETQQGEFNGWGWRFDRRSTSPLGEHMSLASANLGMKAPTFRNVDGLKRVRNVATNAGDTRSCISFPALQPSFAPSTSPPLRRRAAIFLARRRPHPSVCGRCFFHPCCHAR